MKKKKTKSLKILYIILPILIIIIALAAGYLTQYIQNKDITKYEIKTSQDLKYNTNIKSFQINSEKELNIFMNATEIKLNIPKTNFQDYTIFIQRSIEGSGSNKLKIFSVSFKNNTLNFNIKRKIPKIGTADMAYWYLIAIIPNKKLENLNLENWQKPSKVFKADKELGIDNFTLNTQNKYIVKTNTRWLTMQNDGGSHTDIYYQIDLDNNTISKITKHYQANLSGLPITTKNIDYTKTIDSNIKEQIKSLLEETLTKEDINETNNYNFYTILNLEIEKNIHNQNTIHQLNQILTTIDNLN